MSKHMELILEPNGSEIKIIWRTDGGPFSKTLKLPMVLLRDRSRGVRDALSRLNAYVRSNPELKLEADPGWRNYSSAIKALRVQGTALHNAVFANDNPRSKAFSEALEDLEPGAELRVHCSDDDVTLPLGFVFDGDPSPIEGPPSRAHFSGFWLNHFNITMLIAGSGCGSMTADPSAFTTLYALHRTEIEDSWDYLGDDQAKFKRLIAIEVRDCYDWESAKAACARMRETNSVVFVLAHSDGDWLELSDSKMECKGFARMVQQGRNESRTALLILNCCLSAAGGEQRSLLSAVAERGFCGLIGTEAEILNAHALRCGIRLMWELCAKGRTLGDAFVQMQRAEDLFPLNLFYTCYADRSFKLDGPIPELLAAA